jgi:hypothetical protein
MASILRVRISLSSGKRDSSMGNTAPRWLLWASIVLLLWNVAGLGAFVIQSEMSAEMIAALPPAQRDLWNAMPVWDWIAYAVAVNAGSIGAIGLLARKRWAVPLFALCIIGVIVQFSYPFLIARAITSLAMAAFPIFILVMAVVQWGLARNWRAKGWLN